MSDQGRDIEHDLAAGMRLRTPPGWRLQNVANGKLLEESGTGAKLRIFSKSSAKDAVTLSRFAELGLAHLMKTLPGSVRLGEWQTVEGQGWQGCMQMMRRAIGQDSLRLIYIAFIREDGADSGKQDNLSLLLEVPEAVFAERSGFFRFLVPARLQVGVPRDVPAEPADSGAEAAAPRLELHPVEARALPLGEYAVAASPAGIRAGPQTSGPTADATLPVPTVEDLGGNAGEDDLYLAARGQKLVVYAIVLNFVFRAVERSLALPVPLLLLLGVLVVAVTVNGVIKICAGLGQSQGCKIAFSVASVFPLINLLVLVFLSFRTTRVLRKAGFAVGLLGARL